MKVLFFILAVVIATTLMLGGAVLIVVQSPSDSFLPQLLAIFALTVMIYGPLVLGSVTSAWNVTRTAESRSFYKRWLWVVLGLELLAAIAIIVFAVLVQSPLWLPLVFIGGGAVLAVIGILVGRFLLRHDEAHPRPSNWAPIAPGEIRRKIVVVALTFFVVLALGVVVFSLVGAGSDGAFTVGVQALSAAQFALLAAAFACSMVSLPLNRRLQDAVGREFGTVRKVAKVVLGNKKLELDESEQIAAVKYAAIIPTTLAFMLGWIILLYAGLGLQQVQRVVSGDADAFTLGLSVFFVVALVIFIPIYAVRIRRARAYARDHADLLPEPDAEPDVVPLSA